MSFDYAPAELFLAKPMKGRRERYRRFATAADAIRYAVEVLRTPKAFGTHLEVGDERFNSDEMRDGDGRNSQDALQLNQMCYFGFTAAASSTQ